MPTETRHTHCVMDCPDACSLEVELNDGRVAAIGAGPGNPDTAGFICDKVASFGERLDHEARLLYPMRRTGSKGEGQFERISWSEAVEEIVANLDRIKNQWGGEAILPYHYGGSNGKLSDELIDHLFFARLGASRLDKTICASPTTAAASGMYGKMPGVAFADYPKAECIIVWGANPKASNIHLVPYLKKAKANGAFIATVDPYRNFSSLETDLHLPVKPGTDLPVALAMIGHWVAAGALDETFLAEQASGVEPLVERAREWTIDRAADVAGVESADLRRLADVYAASSPALIRCGWGLERNRNGGQAVAAVLAMPALLGKFGVRGGGYTLSNSGTYRLRKEEVVDVRDWQTRTLDMTQLARLLNEPLEPPVKALFVYNANPAVTTPDQNGVLRGLEREDLFTVVSDQVMTDTARYADIVLPAATFLESTDLVTGYGSYLLGAIHPVKASDGEAVSNMTMFSRLGRAMGFDDEPFGWTDEEVLDRVISSLEMGGQAVDEDRLRSDTRTPVEFPEGVPNQFASTPPGTADGRARLTPAELGPEPYAFLPLDEDYPLSLISPASTETVSSMMGEYNLDVLTVTLHPDDAASRGIASGEQVRVFNDLGEVVCEARVTDRVRPGVVSMPKGAWRRSSVNGLTSTALCPDHLQVVGNGACFNDARVEVESSP
jgi:anaerobic selenocysteine-containing dehydrogenase